MRPTRAVVTSAGVTFARCAVAAFVLAAFVLAAVTLPAAPPAGAQACGPAPSGQAAVSVVVDTGSGQPLVRCVNVPAGSVGFAALTAAVDRDYRLSPKYDRPFVCALVGVPVSGCDTRTESWSYWHGTSSGWTYSNLGVGDYRIEGRCAVEGWRYGTGAMPRISPPPVQCEAAPAPVAPSPGSAPPAASGAASSGAGGAAAAGGSTVPGRGGPPAPGGSAVEGAAPPITATAPSVADASVSTVAPADPSVADLAPTNLAPTNSAPANSGPTTAPVGVRNGTGASDEVAVARGAAPSTGPGTGLVSGVALVLALAVAAVLRQRWGRSSNGLADGPPGPPG